MSQNAVEACPFGLLPGDISSSEDEKSISSNVCHRGRQSENDDHVVTRPPSADNAMTSASAPRNGTILIFDWDDTLCPSTWLGQQNLTLNDNCIIPPDVQTKLNLMAEYARRTLQVAMQLGTVVIVTNAEEGWVELSCRKFMPTLFDFLSTFKQLSARSKFEATSVSCPFVWKQMAFRQEIYAHFEKATQSKKSIISIGDSAHERLAAISITRTLPIASDGFYRMTGPISDLPLSPTFSKAWGNCRTKSVKFIERPAIEELMQEHELISSMLQQVAARDDDLDLCIRSIPTPICPESQEPGSPPRAAVTSSRKFADD